MGSRLEQKSNIVRKRIRNHEFNGEHGEEYEGSKFGGFSEYFRRKKIKLQNLDAEIRAQSVDKPQIFRGIVCHVNGYTQPSLNDLHTMIVQHGGGFIQYLDGKTVVTHIIASNLTPKKKEEFKRYRIVKPAWIVDSIEAKALLPWDHYRVIDEGVGQKILSHENGQIISQSKRKLQSYREQTDASWYTNQLRPDDAPFDTDKQQSHAQTIAPGQDTEDDEYPLSEVTSSLERAFEGLESARSGRRTPELAEPPRELLEIRTELETSPATDISPGPRGVSNILEVETMETAVEATTSDEHGSAIAAGKLRPREGSQEPDFSHAVVQDSEVLRSMTPSRLAKMTDEEHNAILLSDPKIRKSTVVNPDFLEQYYRESRLHHLSTWKADLKSQLQALAAEKSLSQKSRQKRLPRQRRYIMHVDFDSFFAAVSLKKYPQFIDKPVVVAHGGGSGSEIASCNYPARKFGISNGMWMKRAQTLCPELKVLPYDFPAYEDASRKFYNAVMATGGIVQSVSIDEALVDISSMCLLASGQDRIARNEGAVDREQSKADELAQKLRNKVFEETGCEVSVGIGANILQAKVALRKAKPAGQYQLKPEEVLSLIGSLEVQKLPGVAWSIGGKLEEIGVKLVKDIWDTSRERLITTLGPKTGEKIWDYARGIDKTEIGEHVIRKSVSAEVNWGVRFQNQEQVDEFMEGLCGELSKRLSKERVKGKQLTVKVMRRAADAPRDPPKHLGHGKCDVSNKSLQLGIATNDVALIAREAIAMIKSLCISPGELRGIGVQMQKLEPFQQRADRTDSGNQRKLEFKVGPPTKPTKEANAQKALPFKSTDRDGVDTKENPQSRDPNKPSKVSNGQELSTPPSKPLNIMGTQFVLPTQFDPSVLSELPADIQAKLARPLAAGACGEGKASALAYPAVDYGPAFPVKCQPSSHAVPTRSQIDPTILEALPEDVRQEILGFYTLPTTRNEQAVLPQSPRKVRTIPPTRQPAKRGRPRGNRLFGGRSRAVANDSLTLTQTNFVARPSSKQLHDVDAITDNYVDKDALDAGVLAALPEDLRKEVLDQQRQIRLQRHGAIDLSLHQRSKAAQRRKGHDECGSLERHVMLQPRAQKPTFTSKKLSDLADLRTAITAWVKEFSDEGPYEDDMVALKNYLHDVVLEEHDMNKAVAVVKWLMWTIDECDDLPVEVESAWQEVSETIKAGVQKAATKRGFASLDFG